jgi:two-component system, LuxR family, sensor histidine kinase DctS
MPLPPSVSLPRWGWRRAWPWVALLALLAVAQSALLALTLNYETDRVQEGVDRVAAEVAQRFRQQVTRDLLALQAPGEPGALPVLWAEAPALLRLEWRDGDRQVRAARDMPRATPLFSQVPRGQLQLEADIACVSALRQGSAQLSRSYFVPLPGGEGQEVVDLCVPQWQAGRLLGHRVATLSLRALLEAALPAELARGHEASLVEGDGTRLARAGLTRGAGVFVAERLVDLPGLSLRLKLDSRSGHPSWIPNLATALVMGLTLALLATVGLLARDGRRRAGAEAALAESLALRQAMENSLVTGLRARDLGGRITYVNPAFCRMLGFSAAEVLAPAEVPCYWPPEFIAEYQRRQATRQERWEAGEDSRRGFETVFMRKNGERLPVLIFEAPLRDAAGRQTGWMSTVLDVSEQRRVEELSRQQQERLAASARLATVGEMASLLSHELNQPLSAIASYATGSLNLLDDPDPQPDPADTPRQLRAALERIATQAERAGRVIKSVHDFVRRREQAREAVAADVLVEAVLPLIRLQARKSGCRIEVDTPRPAPRLRCDRTMVEQVLLNLSRNGIQAMEAATPVAERELLITVRAVDARWVRLSVADRGPGIPPEVARQLFTPFFTTRSDGMGLGLSLCRTVVEQHGGAMDFRDRPGGGCEFTFTLPSSDSAETGHPA